MRTYEFVTVSGDIIPITYISPCDLVEYLMTYHPGVLVGGLQTDTDRAHNLEAFWEGFRLQHGDHEVYQEHSNNLSRVLPLFWHGDEGRGKRRGNTVVVSCQTPFGTSTALNWKKRTVTGDCKCSPPASIKQRFGSGRGSLSQRHREILEMQTTTMKGNCFLHHWPLFIIPSAVHHAHPSALIEMLQVMSRDFKRLFYDGFTIRGKTYNASIIGAKGDLKWYSKIALQRSWENQGRVRDIACCHECMAGSVGLPFEDVTSDVPAWAASRFSVRPWTDAPCVLEIPFCRTAPEKHFKKDIFHLSKVGVYRDVVGSIIHYLVSYDYFGNRGDYDSKLATAHMAFILYCRTMGRTPALRSFTRRLFMLPRLDSFPWTNTKGSDTMLILAWLQVQLRGFELSPLDASHIRNLQIMRQTCKSAINVFRHLNKHNLWHSRNCSMIFYIELQGFLRGYSYLAATFLNEPCNGFAVKPKLHLLRHISLEVQDGLTAGLPYQLSYNSQNCEPNEDFIGKTCRLSRRLDSRKIGERVLGCCMLKAGILYARFRKTNKI